MSSGDLESELIRQAAGGDRSSLAQLLLLHYDGLRRFISGKISPELQGLLRADDVLQQTFVQVARGIGGFELREQGTFRGWLRTIATNLLKDAEKRRRRERRARDIMPAAGQSSSLAALVDRIATDSSTPSVRAQRKENLRCLRAALASLPVDQREVLERYYLRDQSLEQIAEALARSKDAVRGICYRARKNLRAIMGRSSLYFSG